VRAVLGAEPRHAVHIELDPETAAELLGVERAVLGAGVPLAEEVLEAGRRDDLQDPAGLVTRVPERVPLIARLERELAGLDIDHLIAEQRSHPSFEHEAVLVDAVMAVQRRAQRSRRDRMLDQREAAAGLLAPNQKAAVTAAELGVVAVAGANLAGALAPQRAPHSVAVMASAPGDLVDREPLDLLHPPDLRPAPHLEHCLPPRQSIWRGST